MPSSGWPSPPPPPPPPKSNTGLILGVVGAVLALLLVAGVGTAFLLRGQEQPDPVADPGASVAASPTSTTSPTPHTRDPASLDSRETDDTRLTTDQIFPDPRFTGDHGETYRLSGTLETDACTGVGAGRMKELLEEHHCGRMVVGVWLTSDETLFSALLVIPLDTKDDAEDLHSDIVGDRQEVIDSLTYYCPSTGEPGAELCKRSADDLPAWYASFTTFHRYLFVAISLYTDGHRVDDLSEVDDTTSETVRYVSDVLLRGD